MAEIQRDPIFSRDASGGDVWAFDDNHSLADIARWICRNPPDAEELIRVMQGMLDGTDGMVLQ